MANSNSGGCGGDAFVNGQDSSAEGGVGGDAVLASGGNGGHALVIGDRSGGKGGAGGRGGIIPGGDGGHVIVLSPDTFGAGGDGGEAPQADGRGGRGGRSYQPDDEPHPLFTRRPAHMRWPYFEPVTEPGRGGDGADTPQYMARRLIVEQIKRAYFTSMALPLSEAWWDREIVPLVWINCQLEADGHLWRATVVDDEYEFTDTP